MVVEVLAEEFQKQVLSALILLGIPLLKIPLLQRATRPEHRAIQMLEQAIWQNTIVLRMREKSKKVSLKLTQNSNFKVTVSSFCLAGGTSLDKNDDE
jgi:hypothetical protein